MIGQIALYQVEKVDQAIKKMFSRKRKIYWNRPTKPIHQLWPVAAV